VTGKTKEFTLVEQAGEVTPEVLVCVDSVIGGHYATGRVDWEDVWERLENYKLADGSSIDMGSMLNSPAMKRIKAYVRKDCPTRDADA
jgi:hypothetical protein